MASGSAPATPLLYSCIAYHNTILSEHTSSAVSGASGLASVVLPKIQHDTAQKLTYTHEHNFIHFIADAPPSSSNPDSLNAGGLTYLVVADAKLGKRIPFGYLVEIKKRFLSTYDPERTDFGSLPAYGAAAFNGQLKQLMVEYGTTKAGQDDAFKNVQSEIDNVRGIMTENIERVLERGERIDLLVDKTDRLGGSARDFRVRSRGLRRKMWWKNVRLMVLLVVVIIFLVYLLVGFGCGLPGRYSHTMKRDGQTTDELRSLGPMHWMINVGLIVWAFEHFLLKTLYEYGRAVFSRRITPAKQLLEFLLRSLIILQLAIGAVQQPSLLHLGHHVLELLVSTPKMFVNVDYIDVSEALTYIGGKRQTGNHIIANVGTPSMVAHLSRD